MNLSLASVFTDNMVLQRDLPITLWGDAGPGSRVTASIRNRNGEAKTDAQGKWKIVLDPLEASSEPTDLKVTSSTGANVVCRNVLIGEVWLCSGQSNMEWPVNQSLNPDKEIADGNHPNIRLFTVPRVIATEPQTKLTDASWKVCAPDTVNTFSAVAYFFARELQRRLGVPIGLIHSSWGGTPAEAWTSREGLLADAVSSRIWEKYARDFPITKDKIDQWQADQKALELRTRDTENKGFPRGFAGPAEKEGIWKDMVIPGQWQKRGLDFSGILWFRKVVEIPPAWAGKELELSIGATDKSDNTYFNGQQVGSVTAAQRQDSWCFKRTYTVPAELVRSGSAVIAVRIHSEKFDGGMIGPTDFMKLSCPSRKQDAPIALAGTWRYAVEANYGKIELTSAPLGPDNPWTPAGLFNAMIAPLVPFSIRGAIWYQGESNADRAEQYRSLFPAMIRDWRSKWNGDDLAFYFVQLANYMISLSEPAESQWASLREAQALTLKLPHTGMAVAIDIGDAIDIHPKNKQDVGLRLAFNALRQTYGLSDVVASGPTFRDGVVKDGKIHLHFNHADGGLVVRGDALKGFAVAGTDRVFTWCDGRVDGNNVILSTSVKEPRYVRYAWANNPICNLYGSTGLPAVPFQGEIS